MEDILTAATPLVVAALTYLGVLARSWVKAHVAPRQYQALSALANEVVRSIDQLGTTAPLDNSAKLEMATDALVESAKRLGIKLEPSEVTTFIHAAVSNVRAEQKVYGLA